MISIIILALVFLLIAVRQVGKVKLKIWQVMLFGAITVIVAGRISVSDALKSINLDVMLFLFCMFIVGQALEESGYLAHVSYRFFRRAKSVDTLVLLILFGMGFASAFLMNDTLAIIGAPVVLLLARKHGVHAKVFLLALAFAVTIGSVMSPIGNPQNLLIALAGNISNPFITFFGYLLVPTVINLFFAFILLKFFYRSQFHGNSLNHSQEPIRDQRLAFLSKLSLFLILILVGFKIVLVFFGFDFRLTYIAAAAALPIIVFSPKRTGVLKNIDWHTLVFFAALFVLMQSVWNEGFFQDLIGRLGVNLMLIPVILLISVVLSQLVSNVPMVALFLPILIHAGGSARELVALAAGSTIAGNLLVLGAASNVIIIQNAEKKSGETLTFLEFARVGVPLTIINILVYWLFFCVF